MGPPPPSSSLQDRRTLARWARGPTTKTQRFIMGEGGAFLVCKRLEDAEKAGRSHLCVVRGVGAPANGKAKGITAPNPVGQILALRRAWSAPGLDPATVTLLEGHGTSSTRAGMWPKWKP